MGWPSRVVWWHSWAFPRIFIALGNWNHLFLHDANVLHVREESGEMEKLFWFCNHVSLHCFFSISLEEQLYKLQEEKDSRPPIDYDLGFKPTFISAGDDVKPIDKGNIRMVKPVEPNNHDDNSSRLSTRKQTMNNLFSTNEEITGPDLEFNPALFTLSYPSGGEVRVGRKVRRPREMWYPNEVVDSVEKEEKNNTSTDQCSLT